MKIACFVAGLMMLATQAFGQTFGQLPEVTSFNSSDSIMVVTGNPITGPAKRGTLSLMTLLVNAALVGGGGTSLDTIPVLVAATNLTPVIVQGYLAKGDGGGGIFYYDAASTNATNSGTIFAHSTGIGRWFRNYDGPVDIRWFGASTASTNNSTAINDAISWISGTGGGVLQIPPGTWQCYATITLQSGVYIKGSGQGATTIQFTTATDLTAVPDSYILGAGSLSALPALSADITRGSRFVSFASAHGMTTGDVYLVWSTNAFSYSHYRSYYTAGEFFRVFRIPSILTITNTGEPFSGYTSGGTSNQLFKLTPIRTGIEGLSLSLPGGTGSSIAGIKLRHATDSVLRDLYITGSRYAGIVIDRSYELSVESVHCWDATDGTGIGLNYGIAVNNSQRINIINCLLDTSRHGLTLGGTGDTGAVPCRLISVSGGTISSAGQDTGLNAHGNCEYYSVIGVTLPQGLSFGGDHSTIVGNTVFQSSLGYGIADSGELVGMSHKISENKLVASRTYNGGLIEVDPRWGTSRTNGLLEISDNHIDLAEFTNPAYPSGSAYAIGVQVILSTNTPFVMSSNMTVVIQGNKIKGHTTTYGDMAGIKIFTTPTNGILSVTINGNTLKNCGINIFPNITELNVSRNEVYDSPWRGIRLQTMASPNLTGQRWTFENNIIMRSRLCGMELRGNYAVTNAIIRNNISFDNGLQTLGSSTASSLYLDQITGDAYVQGNIWGNLSSTNQTYGHYASEIQNLYSTRNAGVGGVLSSENNITNSFADWERMGKTRKAYRTGRPTTGTWVAGDIVWNTEPTTKELFWICVTNGTPGDWRTNSTPFYTWTGASSIDRITPSVTNAFLQMDGRFFAGASTVTPSVSIEAYGEIRSDRSGDSSQYVQLNGGDTGGTYINAVSTTSSPKIFKISSTITGGATNSVNSIQFLNGTNGAAKLRMQIDAGGDVQIPGVLTVTNGFKLVDGSQSAGDVLTSDANGLATWSSPGAAIGDFLFTTNSQVATGRKQFQDTASTIQALGSIGNTNTIPWNTNRYSMTATNNLTILFSGSAPASGVEKIVGLYVTQDATGSRTVTVGTNLVNVVTNGSATTFIGILTTDGGTTISVLSDSSEIKSSGTGTSLVGVSTNGIPTLRSLVAGVNITITNNGNQIGISVTSGAFTVTTNDFVVGTRYTNGVNRASIAASIQLTAAAAGTAKATLYVEHGTAITNRLSVSAGPLASLVTTEALFLNVSPGAFYYIADETSGAGASITVETGTCSLTSW